jgi:hypothetical protein
MKIRRNWPGHTESVDLGPGRYTPDMRAFGGTPMAQVQRKTPPGLPQAGVPAPKRIKWGGQ